MIRDLQSKILDHLHCNGSMVATFKIQLKFETPLLTIFLHEREQLDWALLKSFMKTLKIVCSR